MKYEIYINGKYQTKVNDDIYLAKYLDNYFRKKRDNENLKKLAEYGSNYFKENNNNNIKIIENQKK
ncbi:hypothetical protein KQI68_07225 [Peptoniphilus sp. MSJ-1]|uniref:Uncharacterized protein n=1 Tax=Peptoniphilus ovalis TaxID=2841503 RepID=A0ABS6FKA3_9FIRM|nr:hypothetical protein [Peptoniphilus ovalis]MBU5669630.1 hypothetical protein [Peptoniphilus ovalis]